MIVLDGTNAGSSASGLTIGASAPGSTIRGLVIDDFGQDGLSVQGSDITIAGNFIGVDVTGTTAKGNATGIVVSGANNTIGGTTAGSGNVISGNAGDGLDIDGSGATGNLVAGNWIGTDAAGTATVGEHGRRRASQTTAQATPSAARRPGGHKPDFGQLGRRHRDQ